MFIAYNHAPKDDYYTTQDANMNKHRDPYWDNLKFVLICLVVLGHFLLPVKPKGQLARTAFYWIYLFHMQAFVFVSGFTSKSYVVRDGKEKKLAVRRWRDCRHRDNRTGYRHDDYQRG